MKSDDDQGLCKIIVSPMFIFSKLETLVRFKSVINQPWRLLEVTAYLLIIVVLPFLFIWCGQDYTDGPYHAMSFIGLRSPGILTTLHTLVGSLWFRLFGDSVISYRILTRILILLASIIPLAIISGLKKDIVHKLRILALSNILMLNIIVDVFGWDYLSVFILSIIYCISYFYMQNGDRILLLIIGALLSVLGFVRFPSISMLGPILVLVSTREQGWDRRKLLKMMIDFLLLIGSLSLCYFVLYHLLHATSSVVGTENSSNPVSSNGFVSIMLSKLIPYGFNYVRWSMDLFEMFAVLALMGFVWIRRRDILNRNVFLVLALSIMISCYIFVSLLTSPNGAHLQLLLAALVIYLMILLMIDARNIGDHKLFWFLLFSILIGFVSPFGSNTGLFKLFTGYIFLLPLVLYFSKQKLQREIWNGIVILLSIVATFSIINKVFFNTSYEDGSLKQLTAEVSHPKLKGIKTQPSRKRNIETILTISDSLEVSDPGAKLVFYGTSSHLFSYLTNRKDLGYYDFKMDYSNPQYFEKAIQSDELPEYVFLIYEYPERKQARNHDTEIEGVLLRNSYKQTLEGLNYELFKKIAQ